MEDQRFDSFLTKMRSAHVPDIAINVFRHYYHELLAGDSGFIPECRIQPIESLPEANSLPEQFIEAGRTALKKTVLIKLNGGLGTTMGLAGAKSLLRVKKHLTFLDIIASRATRRGIPLVLMNSFATRSESLERLRPFGSVDYRIPSDFVQTRVPKIDAATKTPVEWPANPDLEWYPPGHGELYTALLISGLLSLLIESGYRYAFVSNADNLGATLDLAILGFFVSKELDLLMEVAERTESDRKGGHVARSRKNGRLLLREAAQCPAEDQAHFQNWRKHRYFNTNNIWISLESLAGMLRQRNHVLGLPMICNHKTVDPADPGSTPVMQLETAVGAAISVFEHSQVILVSRDRFLPVKTCGDLLAVRSDLTVLDEDFILRPNKSRKLPAIVIDLDDRFYRTIHDLELRFPFGPPSLVGCRRLSIMGDFRFGRNVVLKGDVILVNKASEPRMIPDATVLTEHQGDIC